MDPNKIREEVFRRTGKSIDIDDPLFIASEMLMLMIMDADQKRMQAVSTALNAAHAANEKALKTAIGEVRIAVEQVVGVQENISISAAHAAREVLLGDAGPLRKLDGLVRQQVEALAWMNRVASFYERTFVLWPMVLSAVLGSLIGGVVVRYI